MKKHLYYYLISFLISTTLSCCASTNEESEKEIIRFISDFYTEYINEGNKPGTFCIDCIIEIQKKYCTPELLNHIEFLRNEKDLDFDPFIQAQDFVLDWLDKMTIEKVKSRKSLYNVSFKYESEEEYTTITIGVKKYNNQYKIYYLDVYSDEVTTYND
ncbi:hypothetical protein M2138_001508 [Dysgonomonadaceae bacterium PH5-43]|nr:hypothetical protein [Dysgonomonadaceae bacterium PH5-43]